MANRVYTVPLVITCPWCQDNLIMQLTYWANGLGDIWATGQVSVHVCPVGVATVPETDPLW